MDGNKENDNTEENYITLIDIAKTEYDNFFKRSQTLDTKVEIIMAVIIAISTYSLNIDKLKNILQNMNIINYTRLLLYVTSFGCCIAILTLTACILMSKRTAFLPLSLFEDNTLKETKPNELKKVVLLTSYKKTLEKNDIILKKKNNKFNAICILSIIEIGIIFILKIIEIFI